MRGGGEDRETHSMNVTPIQIFEIPQIFCAIKGLTPPPSQSIWFMSTNINHVDCALTLVIKNCFQPLKAKIQMIKKNNNMGTDLNPGQPTPNCLSAPSLLHWGSVGRFIVVKMTSGYMTVWLIFLAECPSWCQLLKMLIHYSLWW